MKITITSGTGLQRTVTVLGNDNGKEATIDDWLPERSSESQRASFLRGPNKKFLDRENVEYGFSFTVFRSLASYAVALGFIRDHLLNVPTSGSIEISQFDASGISLFFPDAQILHMRVSYHRGCAFRFHFQIGAGTLIATNPNNTK